MSSQLKENNNIDKNKIKQHQSYIV